MRGKFITVEGIEGVGKTSNMTFIRQWLENKGHNPVVTREPGGTAISEKIRDLLLDAKNNHLCDDSELLMMFAARAQHIHELIEPSLKQGRWVLCDRFTDATFAYQGGGRGIDQDRITVLESWVQGALRPDLTLLLDLPAEVGLKRAGERSAPDRFEREAIDFFDRVRHAYLDLADKFPKRYCVIDAARPLEQVQEQIAQNLRERLA